MMAVTMIVMIVAMRYAAADDGDAVVYHTLKRAEGSGSPSGGMFGSLRLLCLPLKPVLHQILEAWDDRVSDLSDFFFFLFVSVLFSGLAWSCIESGKGLDCTWLFSLVNTSERRRIYTWCPGMVYGALRRMSNAIL